jgi:hypothetical protein
MGISLIKRLCFILSPEFILRTLGSGTGRITLATL